MKLLYIEWCDAIASGLDWTDIDVAKEWAENTDWIVCEVGWVIKETKKYIVIASTYKKEDVYTTAQFKHLMKIPKTWIKKRVDLNNSIN